MKLLIRRDQKVHKGLFGTHRIVFWSYCRLELTPEEKQLVTQYRLEDTVLFDFSKPYDLRGEWQVLTEDFQALVASRRFEVRHLLKGVIHEHENVHLLLLLESMFTAKCRDFKEFLYDSTEFQGEVNVTL